MPLCDRSAKPLCALAAVDFEYDEGARVLCGVDLAIERGELVALVGPNGSGKSTCLRLAAGLLVPTHGRVEFEGQSLAALNSRERARKIAWVPQFLPPLTDVRVDEFVLSGRYARLERFQGAAAADDASVRAALTACDVLDQAERALEDLSGGQRQRVLVARALAQEAALLLVDEPTNALDFAHQTGVLDLLAEQVAVGRSAVFVTHDLALASQYATRAVVLHAGKIVADGPCTAVFTREHLEPVYGSKLYFGTWPDGAARGRPFVLPRRAQ